MGCGMTKTPNEDDVLRRMLKTPHKPHAPLKVREKTATIRKAPNVRDKERRKDKG
jgi:hypothetical protein